MKHRITYGALIFIAILLASIFILNKNLAVDTGIYDDLNLEIHNVSIHNLSDESLEELQFLKETLKDKSVVVLGEALHSDGSAFLAKTKIVKYLHQKLGFDVIVFEAGRYDMWRFNNDRSALVDQSIWGFWGDSTLQTKELWRYIRSQDIDVKGFDIQLTGSISDLTRKNMLYDHLRNYESNPEKTWSNYDYVADSLRYYINSTYHNNRLGDERRKRVMEDIDSMISVLGTQDWSVINDEYIYMLSGIKQWWECTTRYESGKRERLELRDSLMANNIINIIESNSRRKVIIWTANLHAMNDNHQYDDSSFAFRNVGEILKEKYPQEMYTILFSSFCRKSDDVVSNNARTNSIEQYLHDKKVKHAIITGYSDDTVKLVETGINQGAFFKMNLAKLSDALFFIDTMENVIYTNK